MRLFNGASAPLLPIATLVLASGDGYEHQKSTNYSTWMAQSIISRNQGVLTGAGDASELLQADFTQKAFRRWLDQNPNHASAETISSYIQKSVDSVIPAVSNAAADVHSSPLDRLSSCNNLIKLYQETGNATYRTAFKALRDSIKRFKTLINVYPWQLELLGQT